MASGLEKLNIDEIPTYSEGDTGNKLGKYAAQAGSGLVSGVVGALPSLVSLGSKAVKGGMSALTSTLSPVVTKSKEEPENMSWFGKAQRFLDITPKRKVKDYPTYKALDYLDELATNASPDKLTEYFNEYTGDKFKAKGDFEETLQDSFKNVGSFTALGSSLPNAIKMTTFGKAASLSTKAAGGGKAAQNTAELLGTMMSPVFSRSMIPGVKSGAYKNVESAISTKASVDLPNAENAANSVMKKIKSAGGSPAKTKAGEFAERFLNRAKGGKLPIDELWEFKKDYNDTFFIEGLSDKSKKLSAKAKDLIEPVNNIIRKGLESHGKANPKFMQAYKNADMLHSIEEGLPLIDKVINKLTGTKKTGLGDIIRKAFVYGVGGIKGLAVRAGLNSLSKGTQAYFRSPLFRQASNQLARATLKQNTPLINKALNKLVKAKEKYANGIKNARGDVFTLVDMNSPTDKKTMSDEFTPVSQKELRDMRGN